MKSIGILQNPIQNYAWGSPTAIPELIGTENPAGTPQAELWMGAHPKAPSRVRVEDRWVPLGDLIAADPVAVLGPDVVRKFGPAMPYLFKVLAAAEPLSIQAHPDREQAREGFARENRQGIPLDDPRRNYKDDNHKPECICALSPFTALCGFRRREEMAAAFRTLCPDTLAGEIAGLTAGEGREGLKRFFTGLLTLPSRRREDAIGEAAGRAQDLGRIPGPLQAAFRWLLHLQSAYPGDIGIFAPIFLNLVELPPGQALFLPTGELHAYLAGTGIELMANSDNVLRGGLTAKHVDVPELLAVLNFKERAVVPADPVPVREGEAAWVTPAAEFQLSIITVAADKDYTSGRERSIEILICTAGEALLADRAGREEVRLTRGMSVMVPAAHAGYGIRGRAILYKASVPGG